MTGVLSYPPLDPRQRDRRQWVDLGPSRPSIQQHWHADVWTGNRH